MSIDTNQWLQCKNVKKEGEGEAEATTKISVASISQQQQIETKQN